MPHVRDFIGQTYQRFTATALFTVPEKLPDRFDPGLVEANDGKVYYLAADGTLVDVGTGVRGGLATVMTDSNGQATVGFPQPFPNVPKAIVTTPKDQLVSVGTLVLTKSYVVVWAWDIPSAAWATNREINLYWVGVFD